MKRKLLLTFGIIALASSCTTDNLPVESTGKKINSIDTVTKSMLSTDENSKFTTKKDSLSIRMIPTGDEDTSSLNDNGDVGHIRDKRK